jgi:imidazolonepropionase-like amidohydrolase
MSSSTWFGSHHRSQLLFLPPDMPSLYLKSKSLITYPDNPPLVDAVVEIKGERIAAVGSSNEIPIPPDATVIDRSDQTVMAAMVDPHTHITINNSYGIPLSEHFDFDYATAVLRGADNLRRDLETGVTTMRALGDRIGIEKSFRDTVERGELEAPRLQVCVRALRPSHGTAPFLAYPADGPEELTRKIGENIDDGADWTKLFVTNVRDGESFEDYLRGDLTDVAAYSKREIETAIAYSHDRGIPVCAHAIGGDAMRWAMEAGIESIEHANLLTEQDVDLFVKSGAYLSDPNLQLFFDSESGFESFGSWEWDWWRERVEIARELISRWMPEAVKAGVKICLATDSTHATLWRDAKCLVGLGVSEIDALKAVTVNGAEMMGLSDDVGKVAPRMRADLIAIDGNPLEDIESLRRIRMVMKDGAIVHEVDAN